MMFDSCAPGRAIAPTKGSAAPPMPMTVIKRIPWVTLGLILTMLAVSTGTGLGLNLEDASGLDLLLTFNVGRVWDGQYWLLLAAPFFHYDLVHYIMCTLTLAIVASTVEFALGRQAVFALAFFGAIFSSGVQLMAGDRMALGATPVIFALSGVIWAARRRVFAFMIATQARFMKIVWVWLGLCLLLGIEGLWGIHNTANLTGLLFGVAAARAIWGPGQNWRASGGAVIGLLAVLTLLGATWQPHSLAWRLHRVERFHKAGEYERARSELEPFVQDPVNAPAEALNAMAWMLATSPQDSLRDGPRAAQLAMQACAATRWLSPECIDTLAAAYAENGQWDKALATQHLTLRVLDELTSSTLTGLALPADYIQQQRAILQGNLEKIERHEKIRE